MIKKILIAVMLFLGASLNISAQNDVVTNETVLELLKEGFSSEEIIGAIENSSTRTITFDIKFMRELKQAGADATFFSKLQRRTWDTKVFTFGILLVEESLKKCIEPISKKKRKALI